MEKNNNKPELPEILSGEIKSVNTNCILIYIPTRRKHIQVPRGTVYNSEGILIEKGILENNLLYKKVIIVKYDTCNNSLKPIIILKETEKETEKETVSKDER